LEPRALLKVETHVEAACKSFFCETLCSSYTTPVLQETPLLHLADILDVLATRVAVPRSSENQKALVLEEETWLLCVRLITEAVTALLLCTCRSEVLASIRDDYEHGCNSEQEYKHGENDEHKISGTSLRVEGGYSSPVPESSVVEEPGNKCEDSMTQNITTHEQNTVARSNLTRPQLEGQQTCNVCSLQ